MTPFVISSYGIDKVCCYVEKDKRRQAIMVTVSNPCRLPSNLIIVYLEGRRVLLDTVGR